MSSEIIKGVSIRILAVIYNRFTSIIKRSINRRTHKREAGQRREETCRFYREAGPITSIFSSVDREPSILRFK